MRKVGMIPKYLPIEAWHLIERLAIKHPPTLVWSVGGFFIFYAVIARLRSGRWLDSILLALIVTALGCFIIACLYLLLTRSGFRLAGF